MTYRSKSKTGQDKNRVKAKPVLPVSFFSSGRKLHTDKNVKNPAFGPGVFVLVFVLSLIAWCDAQKPRA